jgi:hypothetical protein
MKETTIRASAAATTAICLVAVLGFNPSEAIAFVAVCFPR